MKEWRLLYEDVFNQQRCRGRHCCSCLLCADEYGHELSYNKIGTSTIQSRSSAFLVNKKYIFCLPGSSSAVRDAWNDILFYQLDVRHKPCNFIELIPRLDE